MASGRGKFRMTDIDLGWKKLGQILHDYHKNQVVVGVRGEEKNSRREGEITNVELAAVHEFGLGHVPERSFVRATIDREAAGYLRFIKRIGRLVVVGKMRKVAALKLLGSRARADMVKTIDNSIGLAPLADETIARKGSSRPLINTSQLKNSITYEVV